MSENKLLKVSFLFTVILFLLIFLLHHFTVISYTSLFSVYLGAICSTINFVIAVVSINLMKKGTLDRVFITYMKGMIIRMVVLILLIIFSFKFLDIKQNSFIFSILIFYIYYLIIEIIIILKREL